jgi:hypothetical protein
MLALYFGYLVVQTYGIIDVFFKNTIAPSAAFFSIVVFIIWSFIPLLGYLLAKAFGAKGTTSKPLLFMLGIGVALFENSWFYFDWFVKGEDLFATALVFSLFFLLAFSPANKKSVINSHSQN